MKVLGQYLLLNRINLAITSKELSVKTRNKMATYNLRDKLGWNFFTKQSVPFKVDVLKNNAFTQ